MSQVLSNKRAASSPSSFAAGGTTLKSKNPEIDVLDVLSLSINENASGKNGFDCLEIAARVMEIHYPGLPIAKDMRNLVNRIGKYKAKP